LFLAINLCYYQSGDQSSLTEERFSQNFGLEAKYEINFFCFNYQSGDDDPHEDEDLAKFGLEAKYESKICI